MAKHSQNTEQQDQNGNGLRIVDGPNSGYDANADDSRGDQTADESAERTNALNPIKDYPKDQGRKAQSGPSNRRAKADRHPKS